ncbi:MAG: AAA family ATPase [Dysgonamonadaceae bacterium]|jgi:predicted AAA+ superfamily ATPase|nr:AAA family ATPase [Dysgonamonadaceae bacterium]
MEGLFKIFYQLLSRTDTDFIRYLHPKIRWQNRLIAITGARGAGKTTMILQYIKKQFGNMPKEALYVSLDNIWFSSNRLFDLANDFDKMGGKYLFIDEVHKYGNWSQEIKNIYDSFRDLKVVFTGSSMLEIYKGNADLSRRAIHYTLNGMSFREFILLEKGLEFPVIKLPELLENHLEFAGQVNEKIKPIPLFQQYLQEGFYPYYKEDSEMYAEKLLHTINVILETDLPAIENIEIHTIKKIKQLLYVVAQRVPFTPNIKDLAEVIEVSRKSLLNYLIFLEKAQLLNLLQQDVSGFRTLTKPEKIYLNNTNLVYALETEKPDIGNLRETFLFNQLKAVGKVTSSKKADFTFDDKYTFEVGGKNKGHEQIVGLENAYLALDNIEYGYANKIPLWLFGMLY